MNYEFISGTPLFSGCSPEEVALFEKQGALKESKYKKEETILREGDTPSEIGLVTSGSVRIERADIHGMRTVLGAVGTGEVFAEAYACLGNVPMMVDVIANEDCTVVFFSVRLLFSERYQRECLDFILRNLVVIGARKNLQLTSRSIHTSPKTIRERLLSYLYTQSRIMKRQEISVPFDRQQLADYLGVDRSALSKEIGKMKRQGLIDCRKNFFRLKENFAVEP